MIFKRKGSRNDIFVGETHVETKILQIYFHVRHIISFVFLGDVWFGGYIIEVNAFTNSATKLTCSPMGKISLKDEQASDKLLVPGTFQSSSDGSVPRGCQIRQFTIFFGV